MAPCRSPAFPGVIQAGCRGVRSPPARPQTGHGVGTNAAASASALIPSLNGYRVGLMPLRGVGLLAYRFRSSAKMTPRKHAALPQGHLEKLSAFGCSVSRRAARSPVFTCFPAAAVWAVSFCCRAQTWPRALHLLWLTRIAPSIHAQLPSSDSFDVFWRG